MMLCVQVRLKVGESKGIFFQIFGRNLALMFGQSIVSDVKEIVPRVQVDLLKLFYCHPPPKKNFQTLATFKLFEE